jgi:hypothetical protein
MITKAEAEQIKHLIQWRDHAIEQRHRFETGATNFILE